MNHRELNLFLLCTSLLSMITLGWSIRDYYDKSDYIKLSITIALVVIIILCARFFYKVSFSVNKITNKGLYNQEDIV